MTWWSLMTSLEKIFWNILFIYIILLILIKIVYFMDYNLFLFQFEIVFFSIFILYILYFISGKVVWIFIGLKNIIWISHHNNKNIITKISLTEDTNIHANNYFADKYQITDEEKNKIIELLKKIKINISKSEFDLAKNLIVEWLTIDKFHIDLNIELASIYILERDYIKAEYIYKDLLLVHNDDFDILKKLSYVLTMQEKYDLAIEMYKKSNEIKSWDFEIINMLAHLYYHKELYIDAISYLKIFLKENPRDADNIILLGASYRNIWKINDAINTYKRVLEIQPYNEEVKKEIDELEALEYWE